MQTSIQALWKLFHELCAEWVNGRETIMQIVRFLRQVLGSRWLYLFVRIALALLFIYAGSLKLIDPKAFARAISHWGLVPEPLLPVVAIGLPALEVIAGLALFFDLRVGLYAVSGLLLFFVCVLAYGVLNDMNIDCGCFGPDELAEKKGLAHAFYRDLVFLGAVAFLFWWRFVRRRESVSHKATQQSHR